MRHGLLFILIGVTALIPGISSSASTKAGEQGHKNKPEKIAHRGANFLAPECTLSAYRKAMEFRPDYLEIDVHRTADGELVIIHDDSLLRTTDIKALSASGVKSFEVGQTEMRLIRDLDAGSWFSHDFKGERIPTLSEFLDEFGTRSRIYLEFKSPRKYPGIEKQTVDLLKSRGLLSRVTFQSFDPISIYRVKKIAPKNRATLLISEAENGDWQTLIKAAKMVGADGLGPRGDLFGYKPLEIPGALIKWRQFVRAAHREGLYVHIYTLNSLTHVQLFEWIGIDGYFTDRIDLFGGR